MICVWNVDNVTVRVGLPGEAQDSAHPKRMFHLEMERTTVNNLVTFRSAPPDGIGLRHILIIGSPNQLVT